MKKQEPLDGMPTQGEGKGTLGISRDEILLGRNVVRTQMNRIEDAVSALVTAFEDGRYAEIKAASEVIRDEAKTLGITMRGIEGLASGLVTGCVHQLNRRPRT